jgi:hypothetical protein
MKIKHLEIAVRMAAVAALLAINISIARADTYQTYDISGTYNTLADGSFPFSGSLSIDITTDTLSSIGTDIPDIAFFPGAGSPPFAYVTDYGRLEGEITIFNGFDTGGLRVRPETSRLITEFSEHEAD